MTKEVVAALNEVRKYFPEVDTVFYGWDTRWLFCEGVAAVNFGELPIDPVIISSNTTCDLRLSN